MEGRLECVTALTVPPSIEIWSMIFPSLRLSTFTT
jgi:hypothetical protein